MTGGVGAVFGASGADDVEVAGETECFGCPLGSFGTAADKGEGGSVESACAGIEEETDAVVVGFSSTEDTEDGPGGGTAGLEAVGGGGWSTDGAIVELDAIETFDGNTCWDGPLGLMF